MGNNTSIDNFIVKKQIEKFLEEDLGNGDITSEFIPNKDVKAKIISKSVGVICGIKEALYIFKMFNIKANPILEDGKKVKKGTVILNLSGKLRDILGVERTVLNIMMRMSSIASSTQKMVDLIKEEKINLKIAASRKTTPGFRLFEKRAVIIGGGDTHRWRLDDMIMLKDTHLDASEEPLAILIKRIKKEVSFSKKVEVEVENEENAIIAAEAGADIIMLDNMTPENISSTIKEIRKKLLEKHINLPIFEASGNITTKNFIDYAKSGVDIISTSEITMHPTIKVDLSLKIGK
ncbi:MAG: carboxylating nicotinate-nucleotide diphosphorylase [archaeon]|nr:carboxylating nicotinate-nucleotide diphosphorylase [archaeon]